METHTLRYPFFPELGTPRRGKVRDIYEQEDRLTMIASDRISVFDRVLNESIPEKGKILTQLSCFWFDQTRDIIPNHLISHPDPNVLIVKKCQPILAEIIVRGYLVGSLWRDYNAGKRNKCGIALPDGLKQFDPLPEPILTPTTKSEHGHDEDITREELIAQGILTAKEWEFIKKAALNLYQRGQELSNKKGLVLVDTKYEFGRDAEGNVLLIDEIHTPDSSRFWFQKDQERKEVKFPDKEFLREWMRGKGFIGEGTAPLIPNEVCQKVQEGYRHIYELIAGQDLMQDRQAAAKRLTANLKHAQVISGTFALLIAGSESDRPHIDKICAGLKEHQIPHAVVIASAHKHPRTVLDLIDQYNASLEPVVCISIAGRSNALSGIMAANLKWPVIACPPFKDYSDYLTNIHSSLQMPSNVPVLTVIDPANAALAAVKILKSMELCR